MLPRPRFLLTAFALAAATLVGAAPDAGASDHIDGIKTAIDNAADLTDAFAFTSPADPSKLVLIMNVHSLAGKGTRFSNAVDYQFRIRPIEDARTLAPSGDPKKERSITCTFAGGVPLLDSNQHATCTLKLNDGTETVTFDTRTDGYKAGGDGATGSTRVFAGVRSDPWFLDLVKTLKLNAGHPISKDKGSNGLYGRNVLSIVVELDKSRLPGPLLAVTAQTVRK